MGKKSVPEVIEAIGRLMEHDTAGDPVSGVKWTRRTTEKIAAELGTAGIVVCPNTVAKLLKSPTSSRCLLATLTTGRPVWAKDSRMAAM